MNKIRERLTKREKGYLDGCASIQWRRWRLRNGLGREMKTRKQDRR